MEYKALNPKDYPVTLTQSEWMRRMKEMNQMGGGMAMMGDMPDRYNVVVNTITPWHNACWKLGANEKPS